MTPVGLVLVGLLALACASFLVSTVVTLRTRIVRPRYRAGRPDERPDWFTDLAAPAVARLEALGFEARADLVAEFIRGARSVAVPGLLLEHRACGAWAHVGPARHGHSGRLVETDFVTFYADGEFSETRGVGPHGASDLSLGRRFALHRFRTEGRLALSLRDEDVIARLEAVFEAAAAREASAGQLTLARNGQYRPTLRFTLRALFAAWRPASAEFHGSFEADRIDEPAPPELRALWEALGTLAGRPSAAVIGTIRRARALASLSLLAVAVWAFWRAVRP